VRQKVVVKKERKKEKMVIKEGKKT